MSWMVIDDNCFDELNSITKQTTEIKESLFEVFNKLNDKGDVDSAKMIIQVNVKLKNLIKSHERLESMIGDL